MGIRAATLSLTLALGISTPQHLLYFLPLPQGHGAFLTMIFTVPPIWHYGRQPTFRRNRNRVWLPASAGIEFPWLQAPSASAPEVLATNDCRVSAPVADESAVRPGYHLPEPVVRDAVGASNHGHSHGDIHPTHLFWLKSRWRGFYPVTIKGMWKLGSV